MGKHVSTWRCYDCKEDMTYNRDDQYNSDKCPKCGKGYDDGPVSHEISYGPGEFLAEMKRRIANHNPGPRLRLIKD